MSDVRIRLSPPEGLAPELRPMPARRALRWRSSFERDERLNGAPQSEHPEVTVFVRPRAYVRCCAHAGSDVDNEVGGGLVGHWRADPATGEQFVVVEAVLPARYTRHGRAHLTFTHDTLVTMHDELEVRHPGRRLVGWYHTHPRMGVFLSGYDVWLHQHFFAPPWQVALVIEPHSATGGFFVRQVDGSLHPHRYVGFYELVRDPAHSVVHWVNLQPDWACEPTGGG